ncbi:serine-protein kinase ATM-like [Schistocerca serialis cubense]|uniref:serine-protein kinase ATM-like n=1 Tax=Schistocerca serialis cubense TaxID=2023355 RepID=UPI00214EA612|nr:serine-protein kinase ATM-like [Schistocerca serialis cubense]
MEKGIGLTKYNHSKTEINETVKLSAGQITELNDKKSGKAKRRLLGVKQYYFVRQVAGLMKFNLLCQSLYIVTLENNSSVYPFVPVSAEMAHLGSVRNCVDWLNSNEATKRKNGMKQLRDLMNDQTILQELNNSSSSSDVNWTHIFSSAHSLLIKESEKIKSEERKGAQSSAAVWRRNSLKNDCASLVVIIVNKANQGVPRIMCSVLITSILQVLSDHYLRKNYSDKYTEIVRSSLLPRQEYRSKLGEEHWTDLSAVFWRLFREPPQQLEMSAIADVLDGIVKFGCAQSFIGLKLKKKFSVLAEAFLDDNFLKSSVGTQEAFLRLATSMCLEIGKECRMAVCHLGEMIVPRVLHLFDKLSKEKNLVVEFLLLQVRLHHPAGASRSDVLGAAYAANWDLWHSHLRSMFALVDSELSYTHTKKQRATVISNTFLQLAVEVCKQVFHEHSRSNSNQSINVHEPTCSPVLKKRRIAGGLRDIVNNISKMNTPKECWPWLTFLSEYISHYCETVMTEDYVSLLTVVTDQLNSCRDTLLMAHLCRCCSSLLKVDKNLREDFVDSGVVVKLWKNILDVVLRMVGLNQNEQESHYLLQEMVSYDKVSGSLLDVLELYVKGTLRQSDTALKTLIVICNHIRLPEKIIISRRPHAVHNSLITWLLPEHKEIEVFSPSLLANVLALICFKPSAESVKCEPSREQITSFAEELFPIEENYCITSFESSICKPVHKIAGHGFSYATSSSFRASVDEEALRTLEEALERNCQQLLEDVVTVSEEERLKQITNIFSHCELLLELWSWMIRFNTIPVDKVPSFFGRIKILIEKLNDNCTKEIFCHEPSVATKFMQNLSHIMELQHHQAVHKEMRSIIPNNFLTVIHGILTTKNLWGMAVCGEDNDERDEFAVERTSKRGEQTYGSVSLFDTETFSETEKVQLHCVKVLSSYCCYPGGTILSECQDNCLSKLLSLFVSGIGVNTAATFYMAVVIMQKVLEMDSVRRQHIDQCLKVLQGMCRSFHLDYEAAAFIMKLLQGLLRFVQDIGESRDKENTVALLRGLQLVVCKKQYGAKVVAQYIRCLGELAKVDSDASWSLWRVGTKLPGSIVRDETPIAEEILFYVQHPFHELRMMAITFIPTLFGSFEEQKIEKLQWQSNMFESLCKIIMEAFVVEGELSEQERIDESANRTSTALHSVAALLMSNSILRKKSLFFLLQLIREKNISLDLVKKSLAIAGNAMNIIGSKLIAANLKYLFTHWCLSKYQIQEFPWLLLECSSEADFYTTHLKTIVPILFFNRDLDIIEELCLKVGKDLKLVTEVCSPYIIGHLLPIFTMKNSKEMYNYNIFNAEQLLKQLEKILSEDQVKCLLSENMDIVIVTIFRLLFDVGAVTALCGYTSSLPEPAPPTIKSQQMLDTLEYLQKNSQAPEVKLILFLSKNKPRVIQKILLQLALDIHQQLTCEEMIISLHRYAAFADLLGCNLTESSLNALSTFVIREVIHQLINIVRQGYKQNQGGLSIAACNCLLHFLDKCLPVKALVVEKFLGMCTSVLVPVVKSDGYVAAEACRLLEFIIVKNAECLSSGIRLLGPFPAQPKFNEIQKVYQRTVYGGKQYTLEEEIKYFLEAEMYSSCHVERLKHLYLQLSTRKTELRDLYLSLKNLRGFSEDCEESILHRLLCVLVGLTSAEDKEVQLGASRCLGEIGPSDLATLVLQPEKETDENIVLTEDIVVLLIGSVLKKLSVALVDENINVVKETSSALYTMLASKEARIFLESEASRSLNQDYIMPFINHKKSRHDISLDVDTELFRKLVDCRDTWTPGRSTHEKWITNLVCSILQTFDAEKNFLPHLIPVCRVKVSLCEAVLPYLLDLVLAGKEKVCSSIVIHHLQHFFKEHFQKHLQLVKKLNTLSEMRTDISGPEFKLQVIMNRASVQCMLDVVHFLRMRRHAQQRISGVVIELDFLHISLAAQFCSAYFTSILYAELWCHEKLGEWSCGHQKMECQVGKSGNFQHILLFEFSRGVTAMQAARNICTTCGDNATRQSMSRKLFSDLQEDRFDISDSPHSGRPLGFDEDHLNALINNDPSQCTRELANMMNCDHSTTVWCLHAIGKVQKLGACIPQAPSQNQNNSSKTSSTQCFRHILILASPICVLKTFPQNVNKNVPHAKILITSNSSGCLPMNLLRFSKTMSQTLSSATLMYILQTSNVVISVPTGIHSGLLKLVIQFKKPTINFQVYNLHHLILVSFSAFCSSSEYFFVYFSERNYSALLIKELIQRFLAPGYCYLLNSTIFNPTESKLKCNQYITHAHAILTSNKNRPREKPLTSVKKKVLQPMLCFISVVPHYFYKNLQNASWSAGDRIDETMSLDQHDPSKLYLKCTRYCHLLFVNKISSIEYITEVCCTRFTILNSQLIIKKGFRAKYLQTDNSLVLSVVVNHSAVLTHILLEYCCTCRNQKPSGNFHIALLGIYPLLLIAETLSTSPMDTDKMSLLESICRNDKENGQILQHILWEAYTKIGDSDAVYGCWPSNTLDYQSCIQHLKLKAKWDRVLQAHDLELCSGNSETVPGLLNALQKFGLHHVMDGYICSSFVREHLPVQKVQNYYYDCAWRLANWNTDIYFSDASTECFQVESDIQKELHPGSYEKYHYLAMNAIQNLDEDAFKKNLRHARSCVVESLAHASLETSKFLYTVLSQLRALQEMEDFFEVISENDSKNVDHLLKKWNQQNLIQYNDFDNVEPILTQRIVMLKTSARKGLVNPYFQKVIVNLSLDIAALARTEKHFQVAAHYVQSLSAMSSLPPETAVNLKIEEARLLWDRDDKELALCILKGLLSKPGNSKGKWHALSLKLYGDWMVETKSENAQVIMSDYFFKALETLDSNENGITEAKIETYWSIASFADTQYQQLSCYFKSAEYEVKQKYLEKALNDVERLKQQAREGGTLNEDEKRAYRMHERQTQIDRAEIANRRKEMDMYLTTAIRYYILGLECDDTHDLRVFRVAHLWLENTLHNDLNAVLNESLFRVPSYKFLPLLPQLIPHMSHMEDTFSRKINMLIEQCAVDHPHHSLQQILALSNSHKDKEICGVDMQSVIYEPRVIGAQQLVERLKKSSDNIAPLLQQMEKVAAALISLAYYSPKDNSKTGQIPRGELLTKLKNCDTVLVPTLTIPVKPNCQYSNIIGIAGFEKTYQMVGGVNAPKKIVCIGTDGIKRPQLVKGRDDLRQDAVMQQVFTMMNTFLRRNKETSKRKLLMRTYKVVPLSQRSGIIEWCDNTEVLAIYLIGSDLKTGAHRRYYPSDFSGLACRKKMKDVASESNEKKLEVYKEICKSFRPVLHKFFLEYFPAPSIWFERRLAYIHSVATSSMIGYILGLGDRHVNNILIDKQTAEVIHIDFGIAFEMGRILPTPETVPFRLTRDIVDGMGASGVEGVFRRCCEKTMSVLRQNQETILTILEVLLYDPLYSWSVTPKKAYNLQSNSGSLGDETDAGEETSNEVNKMAERALLRLRQKLHGTEEGSASSIAGQVNHLIQQAIDPVNLSRLYNGWQPYL